MGHRYHRPQGLRILLAGLVVALGLGSSAIAASAAVVARGPAGVATWTSDSATTLTVPFPASAQSGDVLVASLAFGRTFVSAPALTAPAGWTLATRTNNGLAGALAVYVHVLAAGESAATWRAAAPVGGTAFVTAYGGVDPAAAVDASAGRATTSRTKTVATPSITTSTPGTMLVASFAGMRFLSGATTWAPPPGMTEAGDVTAPGAVRSASVAAALDAGTGATGSRKATASVAQDQSIGVLTALRPAPPPPPPPPSGPTPLIVDTDIFSDADDVTGLATAFGLQLKGEANVIAVGVNTRTSRPAVATNSWRCVAAVASFYGAGSVPVGSAMPDDGTETNSPDFTGPCGALAPAGTPAPADVVSVYRRALAAQPDGSVVIASTGYLGNLAALLASPADAISPLNGRDLVARKVRVLVAMAGGYPQRSGENNLIGDPASAQAVASGWPTKLVWAGYEVGDLIHTGQTISSVHPTTSPVRVAYEAFVKPGNWIYSYDLVAIYHAIRPADPQLVEVGPGTNAVDAAGGNVFTPGAGNQWYLKLGDAATLDSSIEALLDTLPPASPASAAGPADAFDSNVIDPARWTVGGSGSTVAASGGELEITHPPGPWTTGTLMSATPYDQRGRSVQMRVDRAANGGLGGTTYGETSIQLWIDATHYVEFFVAGGSLTAWSDDGAGAVNLTPGWPAYDATRMHWMRFREAAGTLFWEHADGATAPGTWTTLASVAAPIDLSAVRLRIVAGANTTVTDAARFDDIATF